MPKKANARRYARAVYEIALESQTLELWQTDLQQIAGAAGEPDFLTVLDSPKIRLADKSRLLEKGLAGISPAALNLARLLVVKNRMGIIGAIAAEYEQLVDAHHGIQKARVVTAVPIDDTDKEKLAGNLGALVGSKIVIESDVDPGILGGVIARVGGKLLDGSTRSKLAALKRELAGAGNRE